MKISVTIITLNEERNLPRCLESIRPLVDEIIIVDCGSTDNTLKIARKYGAKIYKRSFDNYANQKNYALQNVSAEWILSLDADEVIPKELREEIENAIQSNKFDGYLIPRRNIILGAEIKHTRWSPDKHIWLWRKNKGRWIGDVHEEVVVNGKIGELKNAKIHYSHETVSDFLSMLNKYTALEAEEKVRNGMRFSYFRMFFEPTLSFFRRFVYKKGFLDGWRGFVLSYLMAIYRMTTWIKVWERQK